MAKDAKHYLPNGKEYKGPTHKMKDGSLHTGVKHTASSKVLSHKKPKRKKKSYDEINKKQNTHFNKKHPNRR